MAEATDFPIQVVNGGVYSVVIPAGQTTSNVLFADGASIMGFMTDSALTSCNMSFNTSIDNVNFKTKTDSTGQPVSIAVQPNYDVGDLGSIFLGNLYIKAISSVVQTNATTITFVMRNV